MSGGRLATAPLLMTNIPTNYSYDGVSDTQRYHKVGPNNVVVQAIRSICLVPNSFREAAYVRGPVIATWRTSSVSGGQNLLSVWVHKPEGRDARLASGWKQVADINVGVGTGNFGEGSVDCRLFAQRQGEYVYALIDESTENTGSRVGYRFNHSGYATIWYSETSRLLINGAFSYALDIAGQYHVSDDENPFIWAVNAVQNDYDGIRVGSDTGVWAFGFSDDGSDIGGYAFDGDLFNNDGVFEQPGTGYHVVGKSAAFRQKMKLPDNTYGTGPILVHPWTAGAYGAPELWWFIYQFDDHGKSNGRMDVYRSQWKPGQFLKYPPVGGRVNGLTFMQMPVILDDDPAFMSGATQSPKLNPQGYGFENDWFNDAHKITTLNFGFQIYNPQPTTVSGAQNSAGEAGGQALFQPHSFRVVRDRRRLGNLHLVISGTDLRSIFNADTVTVHFTVSGDDGSTWSRMSPVQPPIPSGQLISNSVEERFQGTNFDRVSVENLFDGSTVMPIGVDIEDDLLYHPSPGVTASRLGPDTGSHAALLVVDYSGSGLGDSEVKPVIFKRGELRRASWL